RSVRPARFRAALDYSGCGSLRLALRAFPVSPVRRAAHSFAHPPLTPRCQQPDRPGFGAGAGAAGGALVFAQGDGENGPRHPASCRLEFAAGSPPSLALFPVACMDSFGGDAVTAVLRATKAIKDRMGELPLVAVFWPATQPHGARDTMRPKEARMRLILL